MRLPASVRDPIPDLWAKLAPRSAYQGSIRGGRSEGIKRGGWGFAFLMRSKCHRRWPRKWGSCWGGDRPAEGGGSGAGLPH